MPMFSDRVAEMMEFGLDAAAAVVTVGVHVDVHVRVDDMMH